MKTCESCKRWEDGICDELGEPKDGDSPACEVYVPDRNAYIKLE